MYNPQEIEQKVLDFWKKHKTFDKLRQKNKGKKKWSFLDGPITANNRMGLHHAWGRTYKDLFQRFKAMQGYDQRYQNGFDCQGLWIEREEEKDLGLKDKKDIEKFGILNFVMACKKRVEKFSKIQTEQSIRLGQWMDWDHSYYTMTDTNNLHNWALIKKYHDNGWLYQGKDAVPWCPRCGTASSKHDIATEGYKEVTHRGLFMQFPLKGKTNEYFLIYTTTPWTVPANVAIAVNEELDYVKVENKGAKYILAESRLSELEGDYKIVEKMKGKKLKGTEYVMPYQNLEVQKDSPHTVVLWDLASGEEGTGIVHIAPGCGTEDFHLGKKEKLPTISPLDESGFYMEGYGDFSSKKYNEVTKLVLRDLEERKFSYKTTTVRHRYPHCWRCGEELVFRLVDEWYVKSDEIRKKLISENKKVNWYPDYGKARQEEWFKNMGDWLISRERYWGLPLPIWVCECRNVEVIGSLEELKTKSTDKKKVDALPEIHRPWIDEIKIKCSKCKKDVERIKDVGDAWLDAGIVPFSTIGPYLDDKKEWKEWFPVDLISESIPGQFRGWFNALFWSSVTLTGKAPFKALFGYETFKDEKGEEMHKSKGNAIWFDDAVEKTGADPMRLLFAMQDPSQELRFGFKVLKEPSNNLGILYNVSKLVTKGAKFESKEVEDVWIMSKFNNLIQKMTDELENLRPHLAARALVDFWLNEFSRKYIQIIRDRLSSDDPAAQSVTREIYVNLMKLAAPLIPFLTESIWQDLREKGIVKEESVHLCSWPKCEEKKIDTKLEDEFQIAIGIIEKGLAERDKIKIGLKWPLASLTAHTDGKVKGSIKEIVMRQLNVKDVIFVTSKEFKVEFDVRMTPELEGEGFAREISRRVQAERKQQGLEKKDRIALTLIVSEKLKKLLLNYSDFIASRTGSSSLNLFTDGKKGELFTVRDENILLYFSKLENI